MPSSIRVLHTATWNHFTSFILTYLRISPKAVEEAIMTDINDLVQEFRRISSDVGASFFAMRHLLKILQRGFDSVDVSLILFL